MNIQKDVGIINIFNLHGWNKMLRFQPKIVI